MTRSALLLLRLTLAASPVMGQNLKNQANVPAGTPSQAADYAEATQPAGPKSLQVQHGPISIGVPNPSQLLGVRISHDELQGGLTFMFFEHGNAAAVKDFPRPSKVTRAGEDSLRLASESELARWDLLLRAVDEGVDLRLTVKNASQHAWPAIAALEACISPRWPNKQDNPVRFVRGAGHSRTILTPLSDRQSRTRTHIFVAGQLELLKEMGICYRDEETHRAISSDENWMSTWWDKKYPPDPRHPDRGVLIRRDEATGWVLTFAWDDWTQLKTHDLYDCLHVSPRLGPLKPGESKTIHGRIGLFRGTMNEAIRKAPADGP